MEKVCPWCASQPSDRGRLKNRTEPAGLCVGLREETDGLAESWVEGLVDVRSNLELLHQSMLCVLSLIHI